MSEKVKKPFYKNLYVIAGLIVALLAVVALSVTAFGHNENRSYDDKFMKSLSSGLEKRWSLSDDMPNSDLTKDDYTKLLNAELDAVSEYKNKKFTNSNLQEQAVAYINALNNSKRTLKDYGSDDFYTKWDSSYSKRNAVLVKINKINKIEVNSKYKDYLSELLGSGKAENSKNDFNEKLDADLKASNFVAEPKEYEDDTYTTYNMTVKNTTGHDIKSMSATVKLKDAEGTVVDSEYINADEWLKNESTKFDFMTDKEFSSYEIRVTYSDYK